jgi:DNA-binding response OmpR family regulator
MKLRLLIAEHETYVTGSIRAALVMEGYKLEVATDASEVLQLAKLAPYDAIILDVTLPSLADLTAVRQLRDAGVASPLLILSANDGVEDRVRGLDAGADDYLVRPVATAELLARLRALCRRLHPKPANLLRVADLELDRVTRQARRAGEPIALTRREYALLELLMSASPRPVSKAVIIEQVWQQRLAPHTNVVNVYIRNLRRKIGCKLRTPLLHTVRGVGFCCRELL